MAGINKYLPIAFVVLCAVLLQAALIYSDGGDTPARAAVAFTKAYYRLDPAMANFVCQKRLKVNGADTVSKYIRQVKNDARQRGFGLDYMKDMVYNVETYTRMINDTTAAVRLHARRRTFINPVFALIGKFFMLGKSDKIDETLQVIKENGRWKACGPLFDLPEA